MRFQVKGFWSSALWVSLAAVLSAQAPAPARPDADPQQTPTFRVQIDLVSMDVIVKDSDGRFVPDLRKEDFEVYEDGVKQTITSMTMSHGGRVTNVLEAAAPPTPEGIILPARRIVNDTSGRIFVFFVDDLHLQFQQSGRVREVFKKISRTLVHDGDMFGIVSSGPSSIRVDMTYDRKRLDDAIERITGDGLTATDIIQGGGTTAGGPSEVRHRANVAFRTMREALQNLERVTNRRKALVWVSEGYNFIPYQDSRLGLLNGRDADYYIQNQTFADENRGAPPDPDNTGTVQDSRPETNPSGISLEQQRSEQFSDADLSFELGELTRWANRANTTIYTIDPRGLTAGGDIEQQVDPREWQENIFKTQQTLRLLAEETGGLAVVNQNDFDKALKQIDAESSDYYVLGYYSTNPDPTRRRRQIEVKVLKSDVEVFSRREYVLRPTVSR
jgi:VWFA-related protein